MDQSGLCKKSVKESENVGQERNNPLSGKILQGISLARVEAKPVEMVKLLDFQGL